MNALQVSLVDGTHKLKLVNVPKPHVSAGHLLVQVRAAAINPSDIMNTKGGFAHTTFPRIPGREFAGMVVSPTSSHLFGKAVYGTSGNDLGFTVDGAYAEYVLVREKAVALMPKGLSWAQAASVGTPFTTAMLALRRAETKPTDTVMIIGSTGNVGAAASQLAKQMGCKVLAAARRDTADIDLRKDSELSTVKDLTHGNGPDVAIDAVGDVNLMHSALASLATGGRLSMISVGKSSSSEMAVDMKMLYRTEHSVIGCNSVAHKAEEMAKWLAEMTPMFERGELKAVDEKEVTVVSLDESLKVFGGLTKGKFVITINEK